MLSLFQQMVCLRRAQIADLKHKTKAEEGKEGGHKNSLGLFMMKCYVLIRMGVGGGGVGSLYK